MASFLEESKMKRVYLFDQKYDRLQNSFAEASRIQEGLPRVQMTITSPETDAGSENSDTDTTSNSETLYLARNAREHWITTLKSFLNICDTYVSAYSDRHTQSLIERLRTQCKDELLCVQNLVHGKRKRCATIRSLMQTLDDDLRRRRLLPAPTFSTHSAEAYRRGLGLDPQTTRNSAPHQSTWSDSETEVDFEADSEADTSAFETLNPDASCKYSADQSWWSDNDTDVDDDDSAADCALSEYGSMKDTEIDFDGSVYSADEEEPLSAIFLVPRDIRSQIRDTSSMLEKPSPTIRAALEAGYHKEAQGQDLACCGTVRLSDSSGHEPHCVCHPSDLEDEPKLLEGKESRSMPEDGDSLEVVRAQILVIGLSSMISTAARSLEVD